jgi:hypothetical protein
LADARPWRVSGSIQVATQNLSFAIRVVAVDGLLGFVELDPVVELRPLQRVDGLPAR